MSFQMVTPNMFRFIAIGYRKRRPQQLQFNSK